MTTSLACGAAVITSDIRSNGELVNDGKNGILVPASDAARTAEALTQMLENPERTIAMGEAAPDLLDKSWNWRDYPRKLIQVYESAVAGS